MGNISKTCSGLGGMDTSQKRLLRGFNHLPVNRRRRIPYNEADCGISDPPVNACCEVKGQQIPIHQNVVMRESVQNGIVNGCTDDFSERAAPK